MALMAFQLRSVKKWKYDVFLNFLWEDFNGNFVTDLYKRLEDIGIKTFKHDDRSARGAPISTEISEAIEESRIAITIFSGNYVLSKRCLKEITKIMDCVDSHGQEFFPVFYRTEPLAVSRIFDLDKHRAYLMGSDLGMLLMGSDSEEVQSWKDALSEAFDIAGLKQDYYSFGRTHW
ncbi:hypothetical protein KY285_029255 [Solanum tuberosum]|nr:hypothetical protein KY289_027677 [Solanum tuberosum]KAH0658940.1 hypothetical protein KY289_027688 [Solanum tuberosum]KAH0666272.1 hypothetical protein KY285_027478 [Solanum tuberosum]KAH0668049.1 hypothetical protein KY285_029255 [Solanum tuberosum]